MARGVNSITIIGNLGADPETNHTPSDKLVCNLRVAVGRYGGRDNEEATDWFRVVVWEKLAETASKYLKKGSQVYFRGEMRSRKYQDKDSGKDVTTWELHAFDMQMLGSRDDRGDDRGDDRDEDRPRRSSSRDDERPARRPARDEDEPRRPARRAARDEEEEEEDEPEPPRSSRHARR